MIGLFDESGRYESPEAEVPAVCRALPSLMFHPRYVYIMFRGSQKAKRGRYGEEGWNVNSLKVLRALEAVGVRVEAEGAENFINLEGPCLFVSNHMSTLETMVLPVLINPYRRITFVVKDWLVKMPFFRHIMISRDPVVVGRKNPREDITTVLTKGRELLAQGASIVVFPQTTRTLEFVPRHFNTIGVKLAARAGVPIVPTVLKTDAWANGRFVKDFGKIDPRIKVRFAFGKPITVSGRGGEEHERIIEFIQGKLKQWGDNDDALVKSQNYEVVEK